MNEWHIKRAINAFPKTRTIGDLEITMPTPPQDYHLIENWDKVKLLQKFEYVEQPKRGEEPTDEFLEIEVGRLSKGHWFFCNGNLEWITDDHYFFLNYWKDKGRLMKFIDAQRDFFIWWKAIVTNSNLAVGILVTNRRFGKTHGSTGIFYKQAAFNPFQYIGMQSKTNPDVKGVFNKLVGSWQSLPDWLKPIDSGETRPATVLEFFEPRKRSASKEKKIYGEALNSKVDFKSSEEGAYDGEELDGYLMDEAGKTLAANVWERLLVAIKCLMRGPSIRGKALVTTTVEEMEKKGGKNFKLIWDAADRKHINPKTARNSIMGTRLFIPADFGYYGNHPVTGVAFVDEYGYSNREMAKEYILSTWEGLEGDALASAQRKDPLEIKHIFQLKNFDSVFDNELLEMQMDYLKDEAPKNLLRRVTFYRKDDGIVDWRDDPKGFFYFCWDFTNRDQTNKRTRHVNGQWAPMNSDEFAIGIDPFGATMTIGKEKSMGAAYVYRKGVLTDPDNSGLMVCRYVQRTRFKADFHRNIMLMAQYYGCKANYESNIDDYYETFLQEGFKNYVMWRPKCTIDPTRKKHTVKYGTPSNDAYAFQKHTQIIDEYIKNHYHKIYFLDVIEQMVNYDIEDRTKFDEVIAFGMALIGGFDTVSGTKEEKPRQFMKIQGVQAGRR